MGSLELPSEPEDGRAGRFRGDEARMARLSGGGGARDPGERERVREEARAYVESGDLGGERGYWGKVRGFVRAWEEHRRRWPEARQPGAAGRSAEVPGSGRGDGGADERGGEVSDAIADVRKAEAGLSADARRIERENTSGGWLEGFEFRLKGEARLIEKVAEQVEAKPRAMPGDVLRRIPDAIRYTFCFQPARYVSGYYDVKARLESCGHEMGYSKNWWGNAEYKGINTRWVTQEAGLSSASKIIEYFREQWGGMG